MSNDENDSAEPAAPRTVPRDLPALKAPPRALRSKDLLSFYLPS